MMILKTIIITSIGSYDCTISEYSKGGMSAYDVAIQRKNIEIGGIYLLSSATFRLLRKVDEFPRIVNRTKAILPKYWLEIERMISAYIIGEKSQREAK